MDDVIFGGGVWKWRDSMGYPYSIIEWSHCYHFSILLTAHIFNMKPGESASAQQWFKSLGNPLSKSARLAGPLTELLCPANHNTIVVYSSHSSNISSWIGVKFIYSNFLVWSIMIQIKSFQRPTKILQVTNPEKIWTKTRIKSKSLCQCGQHGAWSAS